jgi:hypothetical protein
MHARTSTTGKNSINHETATRPWSSAQKTGRGIANMIALGAGAFTGSIQTSWE